MKYGPRVIKTTIHKQQIVDLLACWLDQIGLLGPNDKVTDIIIKDPFENKKLAQLEIYFTDVEEEEEEVKVVFDT